MTAKVLQVEAQGEGWAFLTYATLVSLLLSFYPAWLLAVTTVTFLSFALSDLRWQRIPMP
jgi:hypothetical protein